MPGPGKANGWTMVVKPCSAEVRSVLVCWKLWMNFWFRFLMRTIDRLMLLLAAVPDFDAMVL